MDFGLGGDAPKADLAVVKGDVVCFWSALLVLLRLEEKVSSPALIPLGASAEWLPFEACAAGMSGIMSCPVLIGMYPAIEGSAIPPIPFIMCWSCSGLRKLPLALRAGMPLLRPFGSDIEAAEGSEVCCFCWSIVCDECVRRRE